MDDETREALELAKDELVEMLESGEPAVLARQAPRPTRVIMHSSDPAIDQALKSTNCAPRRRVRQALGPQRVTVA